MKHLWFLKTLSLILISCIYCIIDRETYNELKQNAPFKVLDYEKILEIFKDIDFGDPEIRRINRLEDEKNLREKLMEQSETTLFLALDSGDIDLPKEFDWRKEMPNCITPRKLKKDAEVVTSSRWLLHKNQDIVYTPRV